MGIGGGNIKINGNTINITLREKQCLELMDRGYSIKEIGQELLISHRTIETHINNIKHKTNFYNRADLIRAFRQY